jgi:protein TonB
VQSAAVVCPNYREALSSVAYPREAAADGIQGEVLAEFTLAANGQIKDIVIRSSTNRVFNKPAIQMIQSRLTCKGQGHDIKLTLPISFKLN